MKAIALIVAAGRGARAGAGAPKQYRYVAGETVLARSIAAFRSHAAVTDVIVAIHADDLELFSHACGSPAPRHVFGGAERQDTVRRGLETLEAEAPDVVLIHDAARPFVSAETIDRVIGALETHDGACAALPAVETMRRATDDGLCGALVDRAGLWRAQTPQAFRFSSILAAHRAHRDETFTDDAEIAGRAGLSVALVEGAPENVKLTTPADFVWAERWARAAEGEHRMETRVGQGFDVHAFGPNADGARRPGRFGRRDDPA